MLPKIYCQRYQEFKQVLEQMQQTVAIPSLEPPRLQQTLLEVQQFFQQIVRSLNIDDLEPQDRAQVQSCQTEMSKQLHLLRMDVMFLQAARQSETLQQRQVQISDRLQILIGYCEALLGGREQGEQGELGVPSGD
ncbi:MAG: heterocyst frequency control protein PatD [Chroococcidiopsidaceae cyanobacterium CP_BM_ER_R8_30]|nr:heterocyst frequency control protein PatD [Chroococcidiopsidaceae cyanobacterium CP_BM_ER_R8_30]